MNQTVLNRSRNDKFILVLDLPKTLKNVVDGVLQKTYNADYIQFTSIGSPVPSVNVPEIKVPYGGQNYYASSLSRPAYPPFNVKFLVDNGYQNYWILWNWLNLFNDFKNSTSDLTSSYESINSKINLTYPMSDYTSSFTIFGLDEFNNKIISFKYTNAFITGLTPIEYSYQTPTEIVCTATFVFNQLDVELLKSVDISNC